MAVLSILHPTSHSHVAFPEIREDGDNASLPPCVKMGVYPCENCGLQQMGVSYGCNSCSFGKGDGNFLCEGCADEGECSICEETCCVHCNEPQECCGKVICGQGNFKKLSKEEMEYEASHPACIWDHKTEDLECGHPGCNIRDKEKKGCYECATAPGTEEEKAAIAADVKVVREMVDTGRASGTISSGSLKELLEGWLKDPYGKKQKKIVAELERVKKRMRTCY